MKEITFKQVLDNEGNFKHLELWQDNNKITIKLGNTFSSGHHSYVWSELKATVDALANQVKETEQQKT